MLQNTPSKYHDKLIPTYRQLFDHYSCGYPVDVILAPGCKRLIFDTDYTSTLHRPNMALNWDGIASIVETGVVTKKGKPLEHLSLVVLKFPQARRSLSM